MSKKPLYTIDTCCLIKGWGLYPPDIFPGVWDNLSGLISNKRLCASEEVLEELKKKDDDILQWAEQQEGFFVPVDVMLQQQVRQVLQEHPGLYDIDKNKSAADPFVVAEALLKGYIVVTEEKKTGNAYHPAIPDVCDAYGIQYIDLLALLREQGYKFGSG